MVAATAQVTAGSWAVVGDSQQLVLEAAEEGAVDSPTEMLAALEAARLAAVARSVVEGDTRHRVLAEAAEVVTTEVPATMVMVKQAMVEVAVVVGDTLRRVLAVTAVEAARWAKVAVAKGKSEWEEMRAVADGIPRLVQAEAAVEESKVVVVVGVAVVMVVGAMLAVEASSHHRGLVEAATEVLPVTKAVKVEVAQALAETWAAVERSPQKGPGAEELVATMARMGVCLAAG